MPVAEFIELDIKGQSRDFSMLVREQALTYRPTEICTSHAVSFLIRKDYIRELEMSIEALFPKKEIILQAFNWEEQ